MTAVITKVSDLQACVKGIYLTISNVVVVQMSRDVSFDSSRDMSHDCYSRKLSNCWPILLLRLSPGSPPPPSCPPLHREGHGGRGKFPLRFSHADRAGQGVEGFGVDVSHGCPRRALPDIQKVLSMVWGERKCPSSITKRERTQEIYENTWTGVADKSIL